MYLSLCIYQTNHSIDTAFAEKNEIITQLAQKLSTRKKMQSYNQKSSLTTKATIHRMRHFAGGESVACTRTGGSRARSPTSIVQFRNIGLFMRMKRMITSTKMILMTLSCY